MATLVLFQSLLVTVSKSRKERYAVFIAQAVCSAIAGI